MKFGIKTLDDFQVSEKTVICRLDINEPVDRETGTLKDISRIEACVPTVRELAEGGARLVLLAHQGSDIEYQNYFTLEPHAQVLSELLQRPVNFIDDVCGPAARQAIGALEPGGILLLDNVRFVAEEQTLFELKLKLSHEEQARTLLVRKLAPLADLYVCDAFAAAHRDQPSLCGFEQVLPSAMGRLFENEYAAVSQLMECPEHPSIFVLGGAKVADAFQMMQSVLDRGSADQVLTGGLVANIMLWASGCAIGSASEAFIRDKGYDGFVKTSRDILSTHADRVRLPVDLAAVRDGERVEFARESLPNDLMMVDIGKKTAALYRDVILGAQSVFANGPMGVFEDERTASGTRSVWEAVAHTSGTSVIGGGDTIAAANAFGVSGRMDYICTAGGALVRFLSGEELPVVKALRNCPV